MVEIKTGTRKERTILVYAWLSSCLGLFTTRWLVITSRIKKKIQSKALSCMTNTGSQNISMVLKLMT